MRPHSSPDLIASLSLLSDETIVERVKEGDLALFELLMRRYNQRLFRVARGILASEHEAEDVVQEAYVRAYERLAQFEGRARFATWLTKIAVNEAITRRSKRQRLRLVPRGESSETVIDSQPQTMQMEPPEEASLNEISKVLAAEVEQLPSDLRAVFVMRAVEELDTKETADCLDLSVSNVKIRLHRARAMLRQRIDERLGEDVRRLYQFDGERCDRIVFAVLARLETV